MRPTRARLFPSYARLLASRGDSRYSWTVDFAARRAKAREEIQPLLDKAASIKATVIHLKEDLKRQKKDKANEKKSKALEAAIREQEKSARDLETEAAAIDAAVFDLKAVNPNAVETRPHCGASLGRLSALLTVALEQPGNA
jgi:type I restriction enzyme M protein